MIRRLLVTDRGAGARRIFATCRDLGIETVAVYPDTDVRAPYVTEADYAVPLPPGRFDLVVSAARKAGADAVHPGFGALAGHAELAGAVTDAGLAWIGAPAKVLALLANPTEVRARVADAGVSTLPTWTDAAQVGTYPVMVKGVEGGPRLVRDAEALAAALGSGAFCEPFVAGARHVEVLVVADTEGTVVTFGERDSSIRRRHQRLIEETPSPAVPVELRARLCEAAIGIARAVGHVGAGSVGFLLDGAEPRFLALTPALRSGHALTECVAGQLDLVRLQLLIAEGAPLPYATAPTLRGHAVGAHLHAEDPALAWPPSTGTAHTFEVPGVGAELRAPDRPGLRLDAAVRAGSGVRHDPLLAMVTAWAPTRGEAVRLLAAALSRARIHGVPTDRDLLVRVLRHASFRGGVPDAAFLDEYPEVFVPLVSATETANLSALAATLAGASRRAAGSVVPSGWRNVGGLPQFVVYQGPSGPVEVCYRLDREGRLAAWSVRGVEREEAGVPGILDLAGEDAHPPVTVVSATGERVSLEVTGIRVDFQVNRVGDVWYVDSTEGSVALVEMPRFPVPVAAIGPADAGHDPD